MISDDWPTQHPACTTQIVPPGGSKVDSAISRLQALLESWAEEFSSRRQVGGRRLRLGSRGLLEDECASFLRAIDAGVVEVDAAGYVRCVGTRAKVPESVYCLFGKNENYISLNTEYLIHCGVAAELILNFGWPADDVVFESGELDIVVERGLRTLVAIEAKARVIDANGLARLMDSFIRYSKCSQPPLPKDNHSRKYFDLLRRCAEGPVILLLVADGARWIFQTNRNGSRLSFEEMAIDHLHFSRMGPSIVDAMGLVAATEVDGEQRAYPFHWDTMEQLAAFADQLQEHIGHLGYAHARTWRWSEASSGGSPLTHAGKMCGLELRISYYEE